MRVASRFERVPMCDKCDELDKKIDHYQLILLSIGDQITVERIKAMIGDLQAQKATLHPEQKQ
jgi:hypothetical protein